MRRSLSSLPARPECPPLPPVRKRGKPGAHPRHQLAREEAMAANELPAREAMEFDVVIVGAAPAALAAAIRFKLLNADLAVVVVEKGSEVGAHILSGAVIDPIGLDRLVPDWRDDADCPLKTKVTEDQFYLMTKN